MGGGKGGGGFDSGPMLEYGEKALGLQKEIYDQTRKDIMPWLNVGRGSIGRLADLMGIGGGALQTRNQIYNELLPQYTTTTNAGQDGRYITPDGRIINFSEINPAHIGTDAHPITREIDNFRRDYGLYSKGNFDELERYGYKPFSQSSETVDMDALNAAVDARLMDQETPSDFGELARGFTMDDYQADPGYQFRLDEGNKAIERQLAARGQSFTPAAMKELGRFNQGMASQEYARAYDRFNIDQNNLFNRLAALSGMGQTATAQTAGAGQNYANQAGNIYGQMGNAVTSAQVASASQPSMFGSLLNTGARLAPFFL